MIPVKSPHRFPPGVAAFPHRRRRRRCHRRPGGGWVRAASTCTRLPGLHPTTLHAPDYLAWTRLPCMDPTTLHGPEQVNDHVNGHESGARVPWGLWGPYLRYGPGSHGAHGAHTSNKGLGPMGPMGPNPQKSKNPKRKVEGISGTWRIRFKKRPLNIGCQVKNLSDGIVR